MFFTSEVDKAKDLVAHPYVVKLSGCPIGYVHAVSPEDAAVLAVNDFRTFLEAYGTVYPDTSSICDDLCSKTEVVLAEQ